MIRRTERLRELGVKATKDLPAQLSDYDDGDPLPGAQDGRSGLQVEKNNGIG